jgi:hypothetical protein
MISRDITSRSYIVNLVHTPQPSCERFVDKAGHFGKPIYDRQLIVVRPSLRVAGDRGAVNNLDPDPCANK